MRIRAPAADFLDGRHRFAAGQGYRVPDHRGAVYVAHGWAVQLADDDPTECVDVDEASLSPEAPQADAEALRVHDVNHAAEG